ncbi:hypothetical protein SESBI_16846 [Sesbania bispinosa]|nr:hypothetical protein SESBI_16846 [Sesbania bispinosa]
MSESAAERRAEERNENLHASGGDVYDKIEETQSSGKDTMLEQDAMEFIKSKLFN